MKFSKSEFWLETIIFLGHVISQQGVSVDPSNTKAIVEWPRPTTVSEAKTFLGQVCYYRRLVMDFSSLIVPLTKLTCKDKKFLWNKDCDKSFQK